MLLLLVAACNRPTACEAYTEALAACGAARGVDPALYDADAWCAEWTDERAAFYGDWYECRAAAYTDALAAGTCASDEGWAAAAHTDACCAPPGAGASPDPTCP